ncbi:restriction endonuclease subunit S [Chitinimonas taiwanensis]|uniref:Type I restriction enzyme, S subunit n=1 Tax=Chitinimonas taiwanensis DSM 18899 TaxID=1121279 RepID=A0A1K2HS25_9NEIS|nr:restriction endonuclease subunit S [Chitinimonas taiwanensis]SFZ79555.1 type I restriction enzyme, S subunit [Chitinimonas taiwanensis DSM 18899]
MKLVEVGDICRFEYGKSLPEKTRDPGQFPVYGSNGPVGSHTASFTQGKTIVIGRKGSIGEVHISSDACWPIDTTYFIDKTCSDCDLDWLAYSLKYLNLADLNKASGVPGLNREDAYQQEIWLPETIEEQRQIAARLKAQLAEVKTARQAAQVQLRDADALRTAIYREAFHSVVPVAVPPHFEDAPDGWRWHKLTDIAQLESGHTPSRHRPDWWGGEVSWISLTEIRALDGSWVESTQLRTNAEGIANSSARILPRGTVCYSRTASVGFVCIMARPMSTSQDFANWVCGHDLEPEFLMHALICSRKDLREIATGATHKTIYMPQLGSFHLCAPDIDDQRRIVAHLKQQLAEADALRAALEQQLRDLDALPQRILALAFEN